MSLRCICVKSCSQVSSGPPGKVKVPRSNQIKLVDVCCFKLVFILATDGTQEAMRDFLDLKGVRASNNYYPDPPDKELVKAFEEHGLIGPSPDAPRVCLTQDFGGKWNKAVLEILTTAFISAVKQGKYKSVVPTWPQMQMEEVRKRCKIKLYSTQYKCIKRPKGPAFDKLNRMYSRRQDVCLCF